jgi:hypothetical protein
VFAFFLLCVIPVEEGALWIFWLTARWLLSLLNFVQHAIKNLLVDKTYRNFAASKML